MDIFKGIKITDFALLFGLWMRHFDDAPAESRRCLGELVRSNTPVAMGAAYRWLAHTDDAGSSASRFVARLLVEEGHLAHFAAKPEASTFEEALLLAGTITAVSPELGTQLLDGYFSGGLESRTPAEIHRILEIASRIDRIGRNNGQMVRFLRHPDSRVRSKVVQLIVRATESVGTAMSLLNDTDDRVRANTLEGLWPRADDRNVRQLFRQYTGHAAPRVAVNALVGLALGGDEGSIQELIHRARSAEPPMQCAAIWAMGFLALPQFEPTLRALLRAPLCPGGRGAVLRALVKLRRPRNDSGTGDDGDETGIWKSPAELALLGGKEHWHSWRANGAEKMPDLSRASLRGLNLAGYDLSFVTLREADLSGTRFNLASLFGADLSAANASGAEFRHSDLRALTLDAETRFCGASFQGACLHGVRFVGNDLRGAAFHGADLTQTEFVNCRTTRSPDLLAG